MNVDHRDRIAALPCWRGGVEIEPLSGGLTNVNYRVGDRHARYVVRVGADIPVHQVMRFNELAASRAAHAAGVSPPVVHAEPGLLVLGFVEGRTLDEAAVREAGMLPRIVELVGRAHREIPNHLRGATLMFWVFHVLRDYAHTLRAGSSRMIAELPRYLAAAEALESRVGAVDIVFGHNDLLAANFIDDGDRLWLIDWDYAGFNSPLFDLGGLASNNGLDEAQQDALLAAYFGRDPDRATWCAFEAMQCASLLRESMWSMVSELHSELDFDYRPYTAENLARFESAWGAFQQRWMAD